MYASLGTPMRWESYSRELEHSFNGVVDAIIVDGNSKDSNSKDLVDTNSAIIDAIDGSSSNSLDSNSKQEVLLKGLELFYYWVTFAPLSRGQFSL
jgi:hypothetical protein